MKVLGAFYGVASEFMQQLKELVQAFIQARTYRVREWLRQFDDVHAFPDDEKDEAHD